MSDLFRLFNGYNSDMLHHYFIKASEDGELDKIKYLLTSKEIPNNVDISYNDYNALRNACKYGHLEIVKYLLTSPDLKQHSDIHVDQDGPFILACYSGNVELVRYFLTSPDLKEHPNIHTKYMGGSDYGLVVACQLGHTDVVKYLLNSPDLKEHSDIHADGDRPLLISWNKKHFDIVNFLIFEMNIEKTPTINIYIHEEGMNDLQKMFDTRELNQQLNEELCSNLIQSSVKSIKI